jgi:hypothetical protein
MELVTILASTFFKDLQIYQLHFTQYVGYSFSIDRRTVTLERFISENYELRLLNLYD